MDLSWTGLKVVCLGWVPLVVWLYPVHSEETLQSVVEFRFDHLEAGQEGGEALKEGLISMSLGTALARPICQIKTTGGASTEIVDVKLGAETQRALRIMIPIYPENTDDPPASAVLQLGGSDLSSHLDADKPLTIRLRFRSGSLLPKMITAVNFARKEGWLVVSPCFINAAGGELLVSKTGRTIVAESEVGPLVPPENVATLSFAFAAVAETGLRIDTRIAVDGEEAFSATHDTAEVFAAAKLSDVVGMDLTLKADPAQSETASVDILSVTFLQ